MLRIAFVIMVACVLITVTTAQRAPYAGKRPTGYKDRLSPSSSDAASGLDNRFGGNDISSSTARLPYDAIGDAAVVDILNRRPVEQRPFWLVNFEAIEAQRNGGIRPAATSTAVARPSFAGAIQPATSNVVQTNDIGLASRFGSEADAANSVISQQEIVYPLEYYAANPVATVVLSTQAYPYSVQTGQQIIVQPTKFQ